MAAVLRAEGQQTRTAEAEGAVEIRGLSKQFKRQTRVRGYSTLKSKIVALFRGERVATRTTSVLKELNLTIPRGASVGLIGRNGSGKSTFLKLLTGIYKPDSGEISVNGRIAALIELGAGFHPDFTGRENVYLGGVMHGLTRREIDSRFDDIVQFAELEHVIDDPVRTYSSGMFMRLGFSLAVHTDPDILLVDEVLAVGDAAFVSKCKERIARLRSEGKTLILVTHDLDAVERWCDQALWLHGGQVRSRGTPRQVIDQYRQFVEQSEAERLMEVAPKEPEPAPAAAAAAPVPAPAAAAEPTPVAAVNEAATRWGSREVEVVQVTLRDRNGEETLLFHPEDPLQVEIEFRYNQPVEDVVLGIQIRRADGVLAFGSNTEIDSVKVQLPAVGCTARVRFLCERNSLLDHSYTLDVAAHRADGYPYDYHRGVVDFVVRTSGRQVGVFLPRYSWQGAVEGR